MMIIRGVNVFPREIALLHHRLASRLRLNTDVVVGPPGSLPRTAVGKVKRVYTRTGAEDPLEAARS